MKRSQTLSLLVLGTAALLAGCSSDERADILEKRYASKEDCTRDWGDQNVCRSSGGSGGYGARYYWNHGSGYPVAVMPDGSERTMTNTYHSRGTASLAQSTATVAKGVSVGGGHSSASVSRGGFGASAHASAGG